MLDFFATVRHRHSVRKYQVDMPVSDEQLHTVLEMACAAPSAGDLQAYRIIAVRDPELRDRLGHAADNQGFIPEAPVSLVFCAEPQRSAEHFGVRGESLYAMQDATIAAAYAQLAIVAAGLGSTWIGIFNEEEIRAILELEDALKPIAILSIGYPAELPEPTPRRHLSDVVEFR